MTRKPAIALVGPVAPFRGGIAQYTTCLLDALSEHAQVSMVSFKRQYPGWLYPGTTDTDPTMVLRSDVDYVLDVYSPLSWRRASDRVIESGCDLALLDWWTLIWQPGFAYIARRLRRHGIATAFLCHNLSDHDASGLKSKLSAALLRQGGNYVVHSSELADDLQGEFPRANVLQRVHPIYQHFPAARAGLARRGRLELLFFGFVRPYKGLEVLVEALGLLQDPEVFLTVVGEPWGDSQALEASLASLNAPNVEFRLEYIDEATAAEFFGRADVVVLPYRSATGSGVVTLAYNYGKPVLASEVGGLTDAVANGETGWLVKPGVPTELAEAIAGIDREAAAAMAPAIAKFCARNSWEQMAMAISELALKLSSKGAR